MPITAGVVGDAGVGAVLASLDMAAESGRAAALDRRHDLELTETDMASVGSVPRGSTAAEDIRDLQNWTRHRSRALRGRRARLVLPDELIEWAHDLADRPGGHLGVKRGGVELGVPEQSCAIIRILLSH
jgi:hypothetical protein